jgi:hypothetical protein
VGTTPAAQLARLKVTYRDWTIRPVDPGKGNGYTAKRKGRRGARSVHAPSLAELEATMLERDRK